MASNRRSANPLDVAIGARLRVRRRAAGLSQQKLAERLGVTFQQVQKYERGANRIAGSTLISIAEAVLGGKVEVPTVNGKQVNVKVPPGTSSGSRIRLPGMGIAGGDQYLVMKVVVPKGKPDDRTTKLIEEYAKLHPDDVRIDVPWR